MPLVVFLKGINVGGHRTFRPSVLARELQRFDVANVGAAGTFVVHTPVSRIELRAEIVRRLPFDAEVMICDGTDLLGLVTTEPFAGHAADPEIVQFVGITAQRREPPAALPLDVPTTGEWCVRVLMWRDQVVVGLHRREMRAIGCLGQLEKIVGAPLAIRSWNTMLKIVRLLRQSDIP